MVHHGAGFGQDAAGEEVIVAGDDLNEVAAAFAHNVVQRVAEPEIARVAEENHAGEAALMLLFPSLNEFCRAVGGAVVADDEFNVWNSAAEHAIERLNHVLLVIIGGDGDGYRREGVSHDAGMYGTAKSSSERWDTESRRRDGFQKSHPPQQVA